MGEMQQLWDCVARQARLRPVMATAFEYVPGTCGKLHRRNAAGCLLLIEAGHMSICWSKRSVLLCQSKGSHLQPA